MPLLVEFLGLPGAGKSEISRRIAERLDAMGYATEQPSRVLAHDVGPLWRRFCKLAHVLRELTLHPIASAQAVATIAGSRQRSRRACLLLVLNWLLVMD